jgi:hypothetical protein
MKFYKVIVPISWKCGKNDIIYKCSDDAIIMHHSGWICDGCGLWFLNDKTYEHKIVERGKREMCVRE